MNDCRRLAEMLQSLDIPVPEEFLQKLILFRDELLRWNQRINLTAITDPNEALEKHLVDSLVLLPFLKNATNLLDIGSGGGFPALPLKIIKTNLEVWSVDANSKKIAFQKHVSRYLGLIGFHACHVRAEDLPTIESLPRFDMVVARAFSSIGTLLRLAKPILREKGLIVAMKGPEAERELSEADDVLKETGMLCYRIHQLRLPVSRSVRALLFFVKKGP